MFLAVRLDGNDKTTTGLLERAALAVYWLSVFMKKRDRDCEDEDVQPDARSDLLCEIQV